MEFILYIAAIAALVVGLVLYRRRKAERRRLAVEGPNWVTYSFTAFPSDFDHENNDISRCAHFLCGKPVHGRKEDVVFPNGVGGVRWERRQALADTPQKT